VRFGYEPPQRGRLPQSARAGHGKSGQSHASSLDFVGDGQKWKVETLIGYLEISVGGEFNQFPS